MNIEFLAPFRTSDKHYTSRPKAGSSARTAWDLLSADHGPLQSLRLIDGYWMCKTQSGEVFEGVEATIILKMRQNENRIR